MAKAMHDARREKNGEERFTTHIYAHSFSAFYAIRVMVEYILNVGD